GVGAHDGVVVDEVVEGDGDAFVGCEGCGKVGGGVDVGDGPVAAGLGVDDADVVAGPSEGEAVSVECVGAGGGVFRVEVFIDGDVAENVEGDAVGFDAVGVQPLVIFLEVAGHE